MKPTEIEMNAAVSEAERLRIEGDDPHFLGRSLLYLHHRNELLEAVAEHAELFLRFGLPEDEHAKLRLLLDKLEDETRHDEGLDPETFGL